MNIDKILICHHSPLKERKDLLDSFFQRHNLEVEWVEDFLPEEIKPIYDKLVGDFIIDTNAKSVCQGQYEYHKNTGVKITIPELSLYLKQKRCLEIQKERKYERILILEDDVLLPENFIEFLDICMKQYNETDAEMMFIGSCCNIHVPVVDLKKGQLVYVNKNQLTRCAHAYVVNLETSEKILKHTYPINWPWDFKLNEIIILEDLKIAWTEPCIYQNRNFTTTLQNK